MLPKRIATFVLLLFVAASLATLAVRHLRPGGDDAKGDDLAAAGDAVFVCFFHGTQRCPGCRTIETYAREAVETDFAAQLQAGRIQWRDVDFDTPANEHFRDDFQLPDTAAIVLVQIRGGVRANAKNLSDVWLLTDNKKAFVALVQNEIRALIAPSGLERD
jgi:hypothetical protein